MESQSPKSFIVPTVSSLNSKNHQSHHADSIISSLLSFPDSSPISIGSSFDRVLDKSLASVSSDESVQDLLLDRTLEIASLLLDSTKRCFRKRASAHNSISWLLPPDLTVKVFSMIDTKSLMQASVCCTMFNKCAMDRLCYSHIDLTTSAKSADNGVVCALIHRAGKELRSLKLGRVVRPAGSDNYLLTGSCLSPLSYNNGFLGSRLRSLWLYNLKPINYKDLCGALSVCSNITDLRIVGLYSLTEQLFKSLTVKCRSIVNLFLETYGFQDAKTGSALVEFVTSCPNLTSLTLIRFRLNSEMCQTLAMGSRKLKYMNLSRLPTLKGRFLRDLRVSCKDGPLETLIMRDCPSLEEKEVSEFCNSLLAGDFKSIRHIDVSNNRGLVSDGRKRSHKPNFPLEKLKEERPAVTFVADFSSTSSEKNEEEEEEELRLIEMMEGKYNDGHVDDDDDDDDDDSEDDSFDDDGDDDDDDDAVEEDDDLHDVAYDGYIL